MRTNLWKGPMTLVPFVNIYHRPQTMRRAPSRRGENEFRFRMQRAWRLRHCFAKWTSGSNMVLYLEKKCELTSGVAVRQVCVRERTGIVSEAVILWRLTCLNVRVALSGSFISVCLFAYFLFMLSVLVSSCSKLRCCNAGFLEVSLT